MRSRLSTVLSFLAAFSLCYALVPPPLPALAQELDPLGSLSSLEPGAVAERLLSASRSELLSFGLVVTLIVSVWLLRAKLLVRVPANAPSFVGVGGRVIRRAWAALVWLRSDRGGALLNLLLAVLGAVLTAMLAGQEITIPLVVTGLSIGLKSAGGYVTLRKIAGVKSAPAVGASDVA